MSTQPAKPPVAVLSDMEGSCMVQVMTIDASGELIASTWGVGRPFTDVQEQLVGLFGTPMADLMADGNALAAAVAPQLSEPSTHIRMDL